LSNQREAIRSQTEKYFCPTSEQYAFTQSSPMKLPGGTHSKFWLKLYPQFAVGLEDQRVIRFRQRSHFRKPQKKGVINNSERPGDSCSETNQFSNQM
jgi:hypothetical protein